MGHLASGGGRSPGASLSVPVGGRAKALPWWRTPSVRRYLFGYTLLAPAVLYVGVLVGAPFLFSLYLALSDASVGAPVARFVGLENFTSALETGVFWTAVRNTLVFTVGAAVMKGFLGTTLRYACEVRNASDYFADVPELALAPDLLQLAEHIVAQRPGEVQDRVTDPDPDPGAAVVLAVGEHAVGQVGQPEPRPGRQVEPAGGPQAPASPSPSPPLRWRMVSPT